ncbi:MAG: HD domain-containing protein [Clostridiales bacterium]|nr:HD domain-containing protein [Clostridiales bacterium]
MSISSFEQLLNADIWGELSSVLTGLKHWRHYPIFDEALGSLNTAALYQSRMHGQDHTQRVLLLAALLAYWDRLSAENTHLLLLAASYHDVGRQNDGYDIEHGIRSAEQIGALTGLTGEALKMVQAMVGAHSRPDARMEETLRLYRPEDFHRTMGLAGYLKDADGLDRVRIQDLDLSYLRHESAEGLIPFAELLLHNSRKYGLAEELPALCREKSRRRQS